MASALRTRFTTGLMVATAAVGGGIVADNLNDSLFTRGNIVIDNTVNTAPAIVYGSGSSTGIYTNCQTGSGATKPVYCTGTTSGASLGSTLLAIENPVDGRLFPRQGSGTTLWWLFTVLDNPSGTTFDIGPVTALTNSSSTLFDNASVGSGEHLLFTGSGLLAGGYSSGSFLKVTAGADPTAAFRGQLEALWLPRPTDRF